MTFQSVFLLPLIALALVVFQPLFKKRERKSSGLKSRRYRKIILGRVVVVVLLLATLATLIWPISGLISLVQGAVMAAAVLVPLYIFSGLFSLWLGNQRKRGAVAVEVDRSETTMVESRSEESAVQLAEGATNQQNTAARESTGSMAAARKPTDSMATAREFTDSTAAVRKPADPIAREPTDSISLHQRVAPRHSPRRSKNAAADAGLATASAQSASLASMSTQGGGVNEDSPAEVQDQLDRVDDMVQSYDLDDSAFTNVAEEDVRQKIRDTHDQQSSISTELMTTESSGTDLAQMSTSEVTQLVTNLRQSKMRLQKLVIAQQAAMETERRAHDQSRTVARDAIKIMRDSRQAQKVAEKLARRERTERQRIELKYKEVAGALDNAMSIIAKRNRDAQAGGKPVVPATPANDSGMLDDIFA